MPVRGLLVVVVIMGLLIVGGFTALVVAIAGRLTHPPATTGAARPPAAGIEMPAGARIETIGVGSDKAVVDLVLPDGNRELLVIELATGRKLGAIPLRTAP